MSTPTPPPSPEDLRMAEAERARQELEYNRKSALRQTRDANRKAGRPEPQPGMFLYVSAARGIKSRRRAGIDFGETRTKVECVDGSDAEIAKRVQAGEAVVNEIGAHAIMADDSLTVHTGPAVAGMAPSEAERMIAAKDAEIAHLRAKLADRDAGAKGEGRPERLGRGKSLPSAPPADFGDDKTGDDKTGG